MNTVYKKTKNEIIKIIRKKKKDLKKKERKKAYNCNEKC